MKKIVIVGAGYGGIETALKLYKRGREDTQITIIDRNPYHTLLTEIHEVAGSRVSEDSVKVPLKEIFKNTKVNVVVDKIKSFDFEGGKVYSETRTYSYDYLVISIGSAPNYFGIPGLEEHGFSLWSICDAVKIRDHIEQCFHEAETQPDKEKRKRLLTFTVGGAGFTGVEMIGELAQWTKKLRRMYNVNRSEIRLIIIDMLPSVLNNICNKCSKKAHRYMEEKLGIEVMLNTSIKKVTPESVETDKCVIETNTLIWAAGVRSAPETESMDADKGPSRRLIVDEYCRTKYKNVYAIGDVGALKDEKGKAYPAMVETALQTAEGAAVNILKDIRGKEPEPVKVKLHGVMVSIGNYYAVADLMGIQPARWIALIMKYIVNMHYINGIMGIKGVWGYIRDEILRRRQYKRFLQRNYTKTVQAWWLVPLRLFLGWTWFYEGIEKILDGWLKYPKLASFLGYASSDAATSATAAEAVTGATGAVAEGAVIEKLMNIDLGFIGFYLERAGEDAPLIFRMKFFLVDWIINGWVLATEGWAMFFQVLIVIMELAIGLAIFSGTLTFLSAVVSLGLLAMFITSTGMYSTEWWMIFASIAIAAGAGRAFGLDHWLLPYIARVWDATKKNGRLILTFGRNRFSNGK